MSMDEFLQRRDIPEDVKDAMIQDLEERRHLKKSLYEAREKLRSLVEQNVAGISVMQDGKFSYVNQKMADMLDYTPQELMMLDSILDIVSDEDKLMVSQNIMKRLFGAIKSMHYTIRAKKKDGSIILLEVHGTKIDFEGKPAIVTVLIEKLK